MNNETPREVVVQIIAQVTETQVGEVKPDCRLIEDMKVDSMDFVDIANRVEKAFGIIITDEEIQRVETVQSVIDLVLSKAVKPD